MPAQVRRETWRRDNGRCVDCGSRERLEYGRIIALPKGGSNNARNIELRRESCNRTKAATI
jgi:5-methylcytosine-specific restriction endonuclease McrA